MKAVVDAIKSIGQMISSLFDFVIGFFEDIAYMVKLLGEFIADIPSYFSWLPGGVVAIIATIFSIVVIYKIIGREG